MEQKLKISQDFTLDELKKEIKMGGKFVLFRYRITLFMGIHPNRYTAATFIQNGEDIKKYIDKYNNITRIFGWWGVPYGPTQTVRILKSNKAGGIDVTDDIMLNLTEEALKNRKVKMEEVFAAFTAPSKDEKKGFLKTLGRDFESNNNYKSIVVGLYVSDENPYLVIGFESKLNFDDAVEELRLSLRKQFWKKVYFEFIDLTDGEEINTTLIKEGLIIKGAFNQRKISVDSTPIEYSSSKNPNEREFRPFQ